VALKVGSSDIAFFGRGSSESLKGSGDENRLKMKRRLLSAALTFEVSRSLGLHISDCPAMRNTDHDPFAESLAIFTAS